MQTAKFLKRISKAKMLNCRTMISNKWMLYVCYMLFFAMFMHHRFHYHIYDCHFLKPALDKTCMNPNIKLEVDSHFFPNSALELGGVERETWGRCKIPDLADLPPRLHVCLCWDSQWAELIDW